MSSAQNIAVMTHQSCDFLIWIFNKFAFKWKFSKKTTTLKVSFKVFSILYDDSTSNKIRENQGTGELFI